MDTRFEFRAELGRRLRLARMRLAVSQPVLADRIGAHVNSVARWETGDMEPGAYWLSRYAQVCGCTVEELVPPAAAVEPPAA